MYRWRPLGCQARAGSHPGAGSVKEQQGTFLYRISLAWDVDGGKKWRNQKGRKGVSMTAPHQLLNPTLMQGTDSAGRQSSSATSCEEC